jgi:hypothetical protein
MKLLSYAETKKICPTSFLNTAITTPCSYSYQLMNIELELYKFRVPLQQAWEEAIKRIVACQDRQEVDRLLIQTIQELDKVYDSTEAVAASNPELLALARSDAISFVQTKWSGTLPDLPDRESDKSAQHTSLWTLVGKLFQAGSSKSTSTLSSWCMQYVVDVVTHNRFSTDQNRRYRIMFHATTSAKGPVDETLVDVCVSEPILSSRDTSVSAIKLITKSLRFKEIMASPDMTSDGEHTLPKLLLALTSDKDFRQVFTWLPLDPGSLLSRSGANGVMPTDKSHYRWILDIVVKILSGKLRQRGSGIDKRTSMADRQHAIMGYLGTIPVEESDVVFRILFARILNAMDVSGISWDEELGFVTANRTPILNSMSDDANGLIIGVLNSVGLLISQMKRKIDRFVPLMTAIVVTILHRQSSDRTIVKNAFGKLNDLMATYANASISWSIFLEPIRPVLELNLARSSSNEISHVFKLVTTWASHASLCPLYETPIGQHLLTILFRPETYPLSSKTANAFFRFILQLGGLDAVEKTTSSTYQQSRSALAREHRKNFGEDIDSEDDEGEERMTDMVSSAVPTSIGHKVISQHIAGILGIVSSSAIMADEWELRNLQLRVTVLVAGMIDSEESESLTPSVGQLMAILASLVGPYSVVPKGKRKRFQFAQNLLILLEAITALVRLVRNQLALCLSE